MAFADLVLLQIWGLLVILYLRKSGFIKIQICVSRHKSEFDLNFLTQCAYILYSPTTVFSMGPPYERLHWVPRGNDTATINDGFYQISFKFNLLIHVIFRKEVRRK